jgi:hypothetical protein
MEPARTCASSSVAALRIIRRAACRSVAILASWNCVFCTRARACTEAGHERERRRGCSLALPRLEGADVPTELLANLHVVDCGEQ